LKKYRFYIYFFTGVIFLLNACSIKKYIPEDEKIYTGASIQIESDSVVPNKKNLEKELTNVLSPVPNSKFLGLYPGLYYYYRNKKGKTNFISKWLNKKIGEDPVYQSDVQTIEIEKLLKNRLENNGFFYSEVSSVFSENKDKASIKYTVKLNSPYLMNRLVIDSMPEPVYGEIKNIEGDSPLKIEKRFDLSNMKLERQRIDANLKERGYYNFNKDFLIFEADTNQYNNKRFDLYLGLKAEVPSRALIPYEIAEVNIYPKEFLKDSIKVQSERYNNKNFIQNPLFFKPRHIDRFITIEEGELYNPETSKNTARRLSSIDLYKYVNIQYEEIDALANDTLGKLKANIYLSPLNKRALRTELQAVTKSNNFTGPNLSLTYTNRNLFFGGENLDITANFGYETQFSSGENAGLNSLEYGLTGKLTFPRVISPVKINDDFFEYSIPKTIASLGVNFLSRTQLYTLISGNATYGYTWNANRFITYEINPVSINYTQLLRTSDEFEDILNENPFLRASFDQQFIAGLNLSFTYNGMLDAKKTTQWYLNSTFDIAGNTVSLLANQSDNAEQETVFGLQYAQYAKADVDLRFHYNFGEKNEQTLATRFFAGYGLAYGNSEVLPYVKQYFSGGPYSVRAFRIRSLGPGTYSGDSDFNNNDNFFDQTGNIRLEANVEYRFPIFSYLKGGIFTDAGNVWNSRPNPVFNGTDVFASDFINELGIGSGFGLRVDVQGFVIRLDLAAPIHDPALPKNKRWNFQYDDPVLNFAIGYSF
jgi:outer membrane protein assembly factor BamA